MATRGIEMGTGPGGAALYLTRCNAKIIAAAKSARWHNGPAPARTAPASRPVRAPGAADAAKRPRSAPLRRVVAPVPRVLARLAPDDPRRRAAARLASDVLSSRDPAAATSGATDINGSARDAGRLPSARRVELAQAIVNRWCVDMVHGRIASGPPRAALCPARGAGRRKEIRAWELVLAVSVDGAELSGILRAHGWTDHSAHVERLRETLLASLERIAVLFQA